MVVVVVIVVELFGTTQSGYPIVSAGKGDGSDAVMEPASPTSEQLKDSGSKVYPHSRAVE